MFKLRFLFILSLTISFVFSNEFDDMFGETPSTELTKKKEISKFDIFEETKDIQIKKNKKANQYDIFEESESKEKKIVSEDDFIDDMLNAGIYRKNYVKQKVIFEQLINHAGKKSRSHSFDQAHEILDKAYAMNFNKKQADWMRQEIYDDERTYKRNIKAKREIKRKQRAREEKQRAREEKWAMQSKQKQLHKQSILKSFNKTLNKQTQMTKQAQSNLYTMIRKTQQTNYAKTKTYKSSNNNSKKQTVANSKYNSSSSYDKKQKERESKEKERKLKNKKIQEQKEREATLKRKKLERERIKKEKELKRKEEKENKQKIEQQYFSKLKSGIKLVAKQCYGEHHVGGIIPKYSPRPVACIDVSFVATCRNNSTKRISGLMENMQSNSGGCFGDTKKVTPKLPCDAKDYIVKVTQVGICK